MTYPTHDTPADRAAAQYIRAVVRLRQQQYEALAWGWFDRWRDLCRLKDRLVRAADQEVGREVLIED